MSDGTEVTTATPTEVIPLAVTEQQAASIPTIENRVDNIVSTIEAAAATPQPRTVKEIVVWNQSSNNISIGLAWLNGDQLNIAIHKTTELPKDLKPQYAQGLTLVKPFDGVVFQQQVAPKVTLADGTAVPTVETTTPTTEPEKVMEAGN